MIIYIIIKFNKVIIDEILDIWKKKINKKMNYIKFNRLDKINFLIVMILMMEIIIKI